MKGSLFVALLALSSSGGFAQVTTATLYGVVTDPSGAAVPDASVTLTHQETNATSVKIADATGDFAFDFLRVGNYSVRVEAAGFKRRELKGLELVAAQTLKQTFPLEVGSVSESVNVEASAPLINTSTSEQVQTFEAMKVTELPLGRRNVSNILRLSAGVDSGSGRSPRLNGIGASGTGISVDGTDANSNPEQRSMSQYGAL